MSYLKRMALDRKQKRKIKVKMTDLCSAHVQSRIWMSCPHSAQLSAVWVPGSLAGSCVEASSCAVESLQHLLVLTPPPSQVHVVPTATQSCLLTSNLKAL